MKLASMTPEVVAMIDARHSAEQRGDVIPVGRLMALYTEHGLIKFPAVDGEGCGPDIGVAEGDALVFMGPWLGLPDLRVQTSKPCLQCQHDCDLCDGSGKKLCEGLGCGGRGWIPGIWLQCPGPGCTKETGNFKSDCRECAGSGQVAKRELCPMCKGTKQMICPRCRGTKKFSTCKLNGSIDFQALDCPACEGSGYQGKYVRQDPKRFVNAVMVRSAGRQKDEVHAKTTWLALGPIHALDTVDYPDMRARTHYVERDEKGDLLFLVIPAGAQQSPQKAYLVGGILRNLGARQEVGA